MSSPWRAVTRECGTKVAMTRNQRKPKQERKITNMKTKIISKFLLTLGLVFLLGSAITQVHGQITIHSTGDVTRGQIGSFVVDMYTAPWGWEPYVYFSVSGTAIPGVDYGPLVSPVLLHRWVPCSFCNPRWRGVIPVKTLPDLRGSFFPQAYSVVVTLESGGPSAQLMINP
jgi:hypothetical protein